ncbi:hypothetical protein VPIG_00105 [Vibrio phage PWH3a-P1]|uniref:hypothetical protein n=1 Tax=Vibrio phage PWH3a-P1 TaxID=754058 RepID=UPI0002C10FE5|nr:hypothetical protein VPIG_00105 [Vibrio phage PWH3a-P1]AGH31962.1 hypothetical protein VPIG_00105 [Vibrio phage PWH3a-P1]
MKDTYISKNYSHHKFSQKIYEIDGSVLTIMGKLDRIGQVTYYSIHCSVCSNDKELYPENIIVCPKAILDRGGLPCGCANNPMWSDYQRKILAKRRCEELGIFLKDIVDSKVYLEDKHGVQLITAFEPFKNRGCLYQNIRNDKGQIFNYKQNTKCSENQHLLEKLFHEVRDPNKNFLYCKDHKVYYFCSCDTCNEYSSILRYSPIFSTTYPTLRDGRLFCWAVERRFIKEDFDIILLHLINEHHNSRLIEINRSSEDSPNISGDLEWVCGSCGKQKVQKVKDFWDGYRCNCFNTSLNGLYVNRLNEDDNLYFIKFYGGFGKIGRSFNIDSRLSSLKAEGLNVKSYKILKTARHEDIFNTEQNILKVLRGMGYNNPPESFAGKTEAFIGLELNVVEALLYD